MLACFLKSVRNKRFLIGATLVYLVLQLVNPLNILGRLERWEWDGAVVSHVLKTAFADKAPLMAVDAAGTFPYFTGFPSIDMLGLNDYHIARTQPKQTQSLYVGHAFSDGAYVFRQQPDIIDFHYDPVADEARMNSGRELLAIERFRSDYQLVHLKGFEPYPVSVPIVVQGFQ